MKSAQFTKVSIVLIIAIVGTVFSTSLAESPKTPVMPSALMLRKTGVVQVNKDKSGKVTNIKLVVTSYNITLDKGSKELESMGGQKVKITGTYKREDDKRWLTVKSVEPVQEKKGKSTEAKPAEKAPKKKAAEKPAKETGK